MTNSGFVDAWNATRSKYFGKDDNGEWTPIGRIDDVRERFSALPTEISWDDVHNEVDASFQMAVGSSNLSIRLDTSGRVIAYSLVPRPYHHLEDHLYTYMNGTCRPEPKTPVFPKPERVIFSGPATIAFWPDGTKTVVKCDPDDEYDPGKGLAMCIAKYFYGTSDSKGNYYNVFHEFLDNENNFKKETEQ